MSKLSKKRHCPAVDRVITPAECGANRGSNYACPADCPHFPFASDNYAQALEIEAVVDRSAMFDLRESHKGNSMEREFQKANLSPNPHAFHAFFAWHLFLAEDASGLSFAQRWEKSGFGGMKNDGIVMMHGKMRMRVALLEIHRVVDAQRIEAVDLLDPARTPMVFRDRKLAGIAARFSTALSWIYPLPHYWRLSGSAVVMPDFGMFDPLEIVMETVRHLGGPADGEGARRWLAEHVVDFDESLKATGWVRRARTFAGMDAKFGKALYELRVPFAECRAQLDRIENAEPEPLTQTDRDEGFADAWVWLDGDPNRRNSAVHASQSGQMLLGRVLLGQTLWRLEAMGEQRLKQMRDEFENLMGDRVLFKGERLDNQGAMIAAKQPVSNESLVPPRLLEDIQQISLSSSRIRLGAAVNVKSAELEMRKAADRAFPDDSIPALNNHTPREAANDPVLRPVLIQLLKKRVHGCDQFSLRTGQQYDANWLLRELGATEILFDPPPLRAIPKDMREREPDKDLDQDGFEEDGDGELFDDLSKADMSLPLARRTSGPLTTDEAIGRLEAIQNLYEKPVEAWDELAKSGILIVNQADELTSDELPDKDWAFVSLFIVQAVLALVPPGHRAPPTSFDSLHQIFAANMGGVAQAIKTGTPEAIVKFCEQGPQPNLVGVLITGMLDMATKVPKDLRPSRDSEPVMMALIKSVIEELDRVLPS